MPKKLEIFLSIFDISRNIVDISYLSDDSDARRSGVERVERVIFLLGQRHSSNYSDKKKIDLLMNKINFDLTISRHFTSLTISLFSLTAKRDGEIALFSLFILQTLAVQL